MTEKGEGEGPSKPKKAEQPKEAKEPKILSEKDLDKLFDDATQYDDVDTQLILDSLPEEQYLEFALKYEGGLDITDIISKMDKDSQMTILEALLERYKHSGYVHPLHGFNKLTGKEIVMTAIEGDYILFLQYNLNTLQGLDNEVAKALIDSGNLILVSKNIDRFDKLDWETAKEVISSGIPSLVIKHLGLFEIDHDKLAKLLIKRGSLVSLAASLRRLKGLDKSLAFKLIDEGQYNRVILNRESFTDLTEKEVFDYLLSKGSFTSIIANFKYFNDIDKKLLAKKMLDSGEHRLLAKNLNSFYKLDPQIAYELVKSNQAPVVIDNLSVFRDLDEAKLIRVAIRKDYPKLVVHLRKEFKTIDSKKLQQILLEEGQEEIIINNPDIFTDFDQDDLVKRLLEKNKFAPILNSPNIPDNRKFEIIEKLIDDGKFNIVKSNLGKLRGLTQSIAQKLIDDGEQFLLADNLSSFYNLQFEIARQLFEKQLSGYVFGKSMHFDGSIYTKKTVDWFIDHNKAFVLTPRAESFPLALHERIALAAIEQGHANILVHDLNQFSNLDFSIAEKLLKKGLDTYVIRARGSFKKFDLDRALEIVISLRGEDVAAAYYDYRTSKIDPKKILDPLFKRQDWTILKNNLKNFRDLDPLYAEKLIDNGRAYLVLENMDSFSSADQKKVTDSLVNNEQYAFIAQHLGKLRGLGQEIAIILIRRGYENYFTKNLGSFQNLDYDKIADLLIEQRKFNTLTTHIHRFKGVDHNRIAKTLLSDENASAYFINQINFFSDLDKEVGKKMAKHHPYATIHNISSFDPKIHPYILNELAKMFTQETRLNLEYFRVDESEIPDMKIDSYYVHYYFRRQHYKGLYNALRSVDSKRRKLLFEFPVLQNIPEILGRAINNENWLQASYIVKIMKLGGHEIPDIKAEMIEENAKKELERQESNQIARKHYPSIRINHELTRFYLHQLMELDLAGLKHRLDKGIITEKGKSVQTGVPRELSFQNKMKSFNLINYFKHDNEEIFKWMRQYLVKAVWSELDHQDQLRNPSIDVRLPSGFSTIDDFIVKGTPEQFRQYLHEGATRFNQTGWGHAYGGPPWASIAKLAGEMWIKDRPMGPEVYVDRVFQIEHNTGFVFDKDQDRLSFNSAREKRLLDAKFEAHSVDELWEKAKAEIHDEDYLNELSQRIAEYKRLMSAPTQEKGAT